MVYRRNRRYKRKPKVVAKSTSSWKDMGKKVLAALSGAALIALKSKLGINSEEKYVDTASVAWSVTSGVSSNLTNNVYTPIPLGDANGTRQGSSIRMTNYRIKGEIRNPPGNLLTTNLRILIVNWGKNTNNRAVGQILSTSTDVFSLRNLDSSVGPFKILFDQRYTLQPSASGDGNLSIPFDWSYSPKNHHMKWTDADTAGTVTLMTEGFITVVAICDQYTPAQIPSFIAYQRVKYVDN